MQYPYIILAPSWNDKSAGVKALYQLCHDLRQMGCDAYISRTYSSQNNPELDNPFTDKFDPSSIVISPELFQGNVLNARKMVRYALNTVGFMGGPDDFPHSDMFYYFSKTFIHNNRDPENLITPPLVNLKIFNDKKQKRAGVCFVARKFREHGGIVGAEAQYWYEIKNHDETLESLSQLFNQCEYFVCYENTYMMFEANLSGCKIVSLLYLHFNELCKFEFVDFKHEDSETALLKYAKQAEHYALTQLPSFIHKTQRMLPV